MSSKKDESVKDAQETDLDSDADSKVNVDLEADTEQADPETDSEHADSKTSTDLDADTEHADPETDSEHEDLNDDAEPESAEIKDPDDMFDSEPADEWLAESDAMAPVTTSKGHERKPYQPMLIIGLVIAIGVAAFFAGIYATSMNSVSEQYIDEAIAKLELKLLQDRLPSEAPQEQPRPPIRPAGGNDPIIGSPDAPIEIIEYSDFQCPFCSRFYDQTLPQLIEEYIAPGKAKLAFRDFPLQNIHPNAAAAALAAECAKEQDKFKGMHDILFERQREWGSQPTVTALGLFSQYAVEIEAEQTAFDACIASQRHLSIIGDDLNEGSSYGVTGTPGFFVGNAQIGYVEIKGAQPYEVFKQIIDAQLGT